MYSNPLTLRNDPRFISLNTKFKQKTPIKRKTSDVNALNEKSVCENNKTYEK